MHVHVYIICLHQVGILLVNIHVGSACIKHNLYYYPVTLFVSEIMNYYCIDGIAVNSLQIATAYD